MRTEQQITARIAELSSELKREKDNPDRHKRGKPGHLGNLGTSYIRRLEGEIKGLEWVLENSGEQSS